ncbi:MULTISPECIES: twin-arginine translocation signal domain-containing protein [Streptomyces]|uniref:Twin-arginine translocation signal domain-containing protein n=1 Tax=Streptomyces achmelvichensis TaxID=3134111 RepID=A0ACC6PLN8_9ACTN|nr:twin-arginine translocation signal domain-containing protein [Streptomyces sp. NBC_00306]
MSVNRRSVLKGAAAAAAAVPLSGALTSPAVAVSTNPRITEWEHAKSTAYQDDWTQQCQGMCTDGQFWYVVSNSARDRRVYKLSLDFRTVHASLAAPENFSHIGSPSIDPVRKVVYVPVEREGGAEPTFVWTMTTALNSLNTLKLYGRTYGSRSPQKWKAPWVAFNPVDRLLYSSAYGDPDLTDPALQVNWLNAFSPATGVLQKQVLLPSKLHNVQGGGVSANGNIFLATDYAFDRSKRIYSYDLSSVGDQQVARYWGNIAIPDSSTGDGLEVESCAIASLSWNGARSTYITAVVLNTEVEDDVYLRHFWVPSPAAL